MIKIFTDGAADNRSTEGFAGAAFVVEGVPETIHKFPLIGSTSNHAELTGIHEALKHVKKFYPGEDSVLIHSDSQYAVRCSTGIWTADPDKRQNYELIKKIKSLLNELPNVEFVEIPRALNASADDAAKSAKEESKLRYGHS